MGKVSGHHVQQTASRSRHFLGRGSRSSGARAHSLGRPACTLLRPSCAGVDGHRLRRSPPPPSPCPPVSSEVPLRRGEAGLRRPTNPVSIQSFPLTGGACEHGTLGRLVHPTETVAHSLGRPAQRALGLTGTAFGGAPRHLPPVPPASGEVPLRRGEAGLRRPTNGMLISRVPLKGGPCERRLRKVRPSAGKQLQGKGRRSALLEKTPLCPSR